MAVFVTIARAFLPLNDRDDHWIWPICADLQHFSTNADIGY